MKIRLNEIPADGRSYEFTRLDKDIFEGIKDLVADFKVNIRIEPITSSNFQITGSIQASEVAECSKCGWDLPLKLNLKISEVLVKEEPQEIRKKQHVHGNQSMDFDSDQDQLQVTYYKSDELNLTEWLHEQIASQQSQFPWCEKINCEKFLETEKILERMRSQIPQELKNQSPFAGLAELSKQLKN